MRRHNGFWYSVERRLTPNARAELLDWMRVNGGIARGYAIRPVNEEDTPLSASPTPDPRQGDEDTDMPTSRDEAKRDGALMGRALATLMRIQNPDQAAVFTVARRFAVFAGYRDVEDALSYIEGFVAEFQVAPNKQIDA